jgi:type II secretory pathway pseudopilin PulG
MVVLAVIAALLGLAMPQFAHLMASIRASFVREDLEQQLLQLPQRVRLTGRNAILLGTQDLDVDPDEAVEAFQVADSAPQILRLDLPSDWTMELSNPILYRFTGVCEGGEVTFRLPPVALRYRLEPPLCRPQAIDAAG